MKTVNNFFKTALFVLALGFVFANSAFAKKQSILKELPHRMLWEIDSPTGTKIYIFGTAHIVDEDLSNVDQEVIDMFLNADERYGELSYEDLEKSQTEMMKLVFSSIVVENGMPKSFAKFLTKEEHDQVAEIIRKSSEQAAAMNDELLEKAFFSMPPWLIDNMISMYTYTSLGYTAAGHDTYFYAAALTNEKTIKGLDKLDVQTRVLTFGTYEEQVAGIKMNLEMLNSGESERLLNETIFEPYKNDDRKKIGEALEQEDEIAKKYFSDDFLERRHKILMGDRNASWANQIASMLKQKNKTFFIFTGVGHWTGEGNVFELLAKKGVLQIQQ